MIITTKYILAVAKKKHTVFMCLQNSVHRSLNVFPSVLNQCVNTYAVT